MLIFLMIMYLSFYMDSIFTYLIENATNLNDLITKIYYPAGLYARLVIEFNFFDLILFIIINIIIFIVTILGISRVYFKINSRLKKVTTMKKSSIENLTIKVNSIKLALIKKELNTFFKIPVFIINAGFGLVLFIIGTIFIVIKFDTVISSFTSSGFLTKDLIASNLSIFILILILITSYMTSITNCVISLEGSNINILKSLPIKPKTILMSKIYSSLILTTPVLLMGDIILFIKFKINFLEIILLIILSILIPLVSHFVGLIINLKYPKLDAKNETEVIKQSTSSFLAVTTGILLCVINIGIIAKVVGMVDSLSILVAATIFYIMIDTILYLYLTKKSVYEFNKLA